MSQKNKKMFFKRSQKITNLEESFIELTPAEFIEIEDLLLPPSLTQLEQELEDKTNILPALIKSEISKQSEQRREELNLFSSLLPFCLCSDCVNAGKRWLSFFFIPFSRPLLDTPFASLDFNGWYTEIRKFTTVTLFSNLEISTFLAISSKYRGWAKASIKNKFNLPPSSKSKTWTTNQQDLSGENTNVTKTTNLQVGISLFPFLFCFALLLRFRYKGQLFSSFFNQNLPGISLPHNKTSWETFQYITSKQLASSHVDYVQNFPRVAEGIGRIKKSKQDFAFAQPTATQARDKNLQFFHSNALNCSKNLEKIDLYNDSILFKTNPCFEKQQKQFYTGFIDKKQCSYLQTSPWFFNEVETLSGTPSGCPCEARFASLLAQPYLINDLEINSGLTFPSFDYISDCTDAKVEKIIPKIRFEKLRQPLLSKNRTSLKNLRKDCFDNSRWLPISARKSENFYYNFKRLNLGTIFDSKKFHKFSLCSADILMNQNVSNAGKSKNWIQKRILDLDELPLKLNQNLLNGETTSDTEPETPIEVEIFKEAKPTTLQEGSQLLPALTQSEQRLRNFTKKVLIKEPSFARERIGNFYQLSKLFQNELKKLYYDESFLPLNALEEYANMISPSPSMSRVFTAFAKLSDFKREQISKLINEAKSLPRPNALIQPRVMSGYQYPDLVGKEVHLVKNQNLSPLKTLIETMFRTRNQSSVLIKVDLPPSFLPHVKHSFPQLSTRRWKVKYQDLVLSYLTEPEKGYGNNIPSVPWQGKRVKIAYQGPAFLRDSKTNDIELANRDQALSSIKEHLLFDNPLKDWKRNFLGRSVGFQVLSDLPLNLSGLTSEELEQQKIQVNKIESRNQTIPLDNSWTSNTNFISQGSQPLDERDIKQLLIPTNVFQQRLVDFDSTQKEVEEFGIHNSRKTVLFDEHFPIIPSYSKDQVPFLKESEWRSILNSLETEYIRQKSLIKKESLPVLPETGQSENDSKKYIFRVFAPAFLIQIPKHQLNLWPLNRLDYQPTNLSFAKNLLISTSRSDIKNNLETLPTLESSIPLTQASAVKIELHYFPYSQNIFTLIPIEETSFGGLYKKTLTVYSCPRCRRQSKGNKETDLPAFEKWSSNVLNRFQEPFQQSWEPVTTRSWLVVTQFSFGFFVLQILQSFYANYGKELISYFIDLIAHLGFVDEGLKDELGLGDNDKGFRLIRKVKKQFQDVAGIDHILPELGEIVWFLRNSGRSFNIGNILPKGILFVGPPGTGKTLLVQAIAGEAEVPVLIQSGSSLVDPDQKGKGADTLTDLFDQARQISPCIVFIDEIDTLGQSRESVMNNPMGDDELIESIGSSVHSTTQFPDFLPEPKIRNDFDGSYQKGNENHLPGLMQQGQRPETSLIERLQQVSDKKQANKEKLKLLMQFLIELDGLKGRNGVVVIGATNRPEVLDSALIRPGRFDRILNLAYPGKQKRIEILKLYSSNIGIEETISWNYLANRTLNLSAADLAAAMNQSSIQGILRNTCHTIETIEHGIDVITGYSTEKPQFQSKSVKDPFFVNRFAFYQAGKAVLHTLLSYHSNPVVLHLWPKPKTTRLTFKNNLIEASKELHNRAELEASLVGLYAGKAAELLSLSKNLNFSPTFAGVYEIGNFKKVIGKVENPKKTPSHTNFRFVKGQKIVLSKSSISTSKTPKSPNILIDQNVTLPASTQAREKGTIFSLEEGKSTDANQQLLKTPLARVAAGRARAKNQTQKEFEFEIAKKMTLWHSNLGIEDLFVASSLAYWMINRWYFYSNKIAIRKNNQLVKNKNDEQRFETELVELFEHLLEQIKNRFAQETESFKSFQRWSLRPWWQTQLTNEEYSFNFRYDDWYRIHLPDPKESEMNQEWVPPDQFYHDGEILKNLVPNKERIISLTWNNLSKIDRDYIYHGLIMTAFDKGFSLLDENREILDFFADFLMRHQILRQEDISKIFNDFGYHLNSSIDDAKNSRNATFEKDPTKDKSHQKDQYLLERGWGKDSRRQVSRFLNLDKTVSKLTGPDKTVSKLTGSGKHPLSFFGK